MQNQRNLHIYRLWAPVYDLLFQSLFAQARRQLLERLNPQPGERWLVPGVGTRQDLPYFAADAQVIAGDLSAAMLLRARVKPTASTTAFHIVDAQYLPFPAATFDGILLNLILSVMPDGAQEFRDAWRVLKPGGRIGIFDKFIPKWQTLSPARRVIGAVVRQLGTDPNRRLVDLTSGVSDLKIMGHQPTLLAGQYQLVWFAKSGN